MQNYRLEFIGELTKKLFRSPRIIGVYWTADSGEQLLVLVVLIKTTETVLKYEAYYDVSLMKSSVSVVVNEAFERVNTVLDGDTQCN